MSSIDDDNTLSMDNNAPDFRNSSALDNNASVNPLAPVNLPEDGPVLPAPIALPDCIQKTILASINDDVVTYQAFTATQIVLSAVVGSPPTTLFPPNGGMVKNLLTLVDQIREFNNTGRRACEEAFAFLQDQIVGIDQRADLRVLEAETDASRLAADAVRNAAEKDVEIARLRKALDDCENGRGKNSKSVPSTEPIVVAQDVRSMIVLMGHNVVNTQRLVNNGLSSLSNTTSGSACIPSQSHGNPYGADCQIDFNTYMRLYAENIGFTEALQARINQLEVTLIDACVASPSISPSAQYTAEIYQLRVEARAQRGQLDRLTRAKDDAIKERDALQKVLDECCKKQSSFQSPKDKSEQQLLQAQLDDANSRLSDLDAQHKAHIYQLTMTNNAKRGQLDRLNLVEDAATKERDAFQKALDECCKRQSSPKSTNDRSEQQYLRTQLENANHRLGELDAQVTTLTDERDNMEAQATEAVVLAEGFQRTLVQDQANQDHGAVADAVALTTAIAANTALQLRIHGLRERNNSLLQTNSLLQAQLDIVTTTQIDARTPTADDGCDKALHTLQETVNGLLQQNILLQAQIDHAGAIQIDAPPATASKDAAQGALRILRAWVRRLIDQNDLLRAQISNADTIFDTSPVVADTGVTQEELHTLREADHDLREANAMLQAQIDHAGMQINTSLATADGGAAQDKLHTLREQNHSLVQQSRDLFQQTALLPAQIDAHPAVADSTTQQELHTLREQNQDLVEEKIRLQAQIGNAGGMQLDTPADIDDAQTKIKCLESRIEFLKEQLQKTTDAQQALIDAGADNDAKIQRLRDTIKVLNEETTRSRRDLASVRTINAILTAKHNAQNDAPAAAPSAADAAEIRHLARRIVAHEKTIADLTQQLADCEASNGGAPSSQPTVPIASDAAKIQRLNKEIRNLKKKLADAEAARDDGPAGLEDVATILHLQNQIKALNKEIAGHIKDNKALDRKLKAVDKGAGPAASRKKATAGEVAALARSQANNTGLVKQILKLKDQLAAAQGDGPTAEDLADVQRRLDVATQQLGTATAERNQARGERDQAVAAINDGALADVQALNTRIAELTKERDDAGKMLTDAQDKAQKDEAHCEEEKKKLRAQIAKLKAELEQQKQAIQDLQDAQANAGNYGDRSPSNKSDSSNTDPLVQAIVANVKYQKQIKTLQAQLKAAKDAASRAIPDESQALADLRQQHTNDEAQILALLLVQTGIQDELAVLRDAARQAGPPRRPSETDRIIARQTAELIELRAAQGMPEPISPSAPLRAQIVDLQAQVVSAYARGQAAAFKLMADMADNESEHVKPDASPRTTRAQAKAAAAAATSSSSSSSPSQRNKSPGADDRPAFQQLRNSSCPEELNSEQDSHSSRFADLHNLPKTSRPTTRSTPNPAAAPPASVTGSKRKATTQDPDTDDADDQNDVPPVGKLLSRAEACVKDRKVSIQIVPSGRALRSKTAAAPKAKPAPK